MPLTLESQRTANSDLGFADLYPFSDGISFCLSQGTKLTSSQLFSILSCYITDPAALLDQGAFLLLFQQVDSKVLQAALNEISVQVILASQGTLFDSYLGALQPQVSSMSLLQLHKNKSSSFSTNQPILPFQILLKTLFSYSP